MTEFDHTRLEEALEQLGREVRRAGKVIDIAIYGGSCLQLASDFRRITKDVDAVAVSDQQGLEEAARHVAARLGLPESWLNDGVRTFLAPEDAAYRSFFGSYPSETEPGLRVFLPVPEYMLAMKLMAMRIDPASGGKDLDDILSLLAICRIEHKEDLVGLAAGFYPEARISGKLMLALDGIWHEKQRRDREQHPEPAWVARRGGAAGR